MGGIIVVDFIDMAKGEHRQQLYEHMREIMANDRARHNILPLSKFGLMQITRQRVRPALTINTVERCPSCFGKGEVQPSLLFTDTLFEKLDYIVNTLKVTDFIMYIHPFVDAYIKRGFFTSMYRRWRYKLGRSFKVLPDESLAFLEYKVLDSNRNEIDVKEEKDMNASSAEKVTNKAKKRGAEAAAEHLSAIEFAEDAAPAHDEKPAAETEAKAKPKRRRKKKTADEAAVDSAETKAGETAQSSANTEATADTAVVEADSADNEAASADNPAAEQTPKPKKTRRKPKPKPKADESKDSAETQATASDSEAQTTEDKADKTEKLLPAIPLSNTRSTIEE